MKEYDVIVIGSGAGMIIVEGALSQGLKVVLVDRGLLGGTCLNVGCIPSKKGMHIHPALPEVVLATFRNLEEPL